MVVLILGYALKIGTLVKDDAGRFELCWNVKGCAIVCLQLCDMVMNNFSEMVSKIESIAS